MPRFHEPARLNLRGCITALLVLVILGFAHPSSAVAATFTLVCTGESSDIDALLSALATANTNNQADTIVLPADCVYGLISPLSIQADLGNPLTIHGNGATVRSGTISNLIVIDAGATVEIGDLNLNIGNVAILNAGNLTLNHSRISDVRTAIVNSGGMTIHSSTLRDNGTSSADAGGIHNTGGLSLVNSTVLDNEGDLGAGIYNYTGGFLFLHNSTISGNTSLVGGGVFNAGTMQIRNSILANNSGNDCANAVSGTLTVQFSMVEDGSCGVVNGSGGNQTGVDPNLGALTGWPGHLPLTHDSPAADAGSNALIPVGTTRDQANRPRTLNATVDMGSYESSPPTSMTVQLNLEGRTNPPGGAWIQNVRVELRPPGGGAHYLTFAQTSNTFGRIFLTDLFPGAYDLWIKTDHTLAVVVPLLLTPGDSLTGIGQPLREGDANDDNAVAIGDFSILAAAFGSASGAAGYDARADFNGDGAVGINDFSLLAANFLQTGAD